MIDRHLQAMLLREKGNNRKLAEEVLEKLSHESKERLFRILQDHEHDKIHLERKARMPWTTMR
jgi:uncharacterized protein (DUF302 family)